MNRGLTKAATQAALLAAARVAFERCGYEGASLRRIAADAGFTAGAIFSHWPSGKPGLWRDVYRGAPDAARMFEVVFGQAKRTAESLSAQLEKKEA